MEVGSQSRRLLATGRWQWLTQASRLVLKTTKPPKIVVCIRPSTWEAWCTLQVTTLAYRHLSGAGCLSGLASFNLAKPEKTQKITKKNPHRSSADPRRVTILKNLRAQGTLISEPRIFTPCDMRFLPCDTEKLAVSKGIRFKMAIFPV